MLISKVAPKQWRGALVTLSEVALSLGILLAYIVNYLLSGVDSQWRWMIGLGAAPDVLLALRMLFLPESPRFLVGKGKLERARKVQRRILHRGFIQVYCVSERCWECVSKARRIRTSPGF